MTPAEQEQILAFGFNCYINVIIAMIYTITSGIATLGLLIAIWVLQIRTWRDPKAIQLSCCIFIWLCLIGQNITGYIIAFGEIRFGIVKEIPAPPLSLIISYDIQSFLSAAMIVAGDVVICWRAWVLLPYDKFWRFVLAITLICSIGTNIADTLFDLFEESGLVAEHTPILDWVFEAFSSVANITATSLIGWKAWAHYRTIRGVLARGESRAQKILLFLVESGAIFLVIQLFAVIGAIVTSTPTVENLATIMLFAHAGQNVWVASAALYPIAIIILVHSDNSPIAETLHLTAQLPTLSAS